ncbi:hypothetical protein KFZ70_08155 [Tamlana fucoidanivorans]|uniref:DUF975 family protein n=1 Tax=Allotamlana fucoidanivorans TaxID=2583814 RepID=A0A5C4SIR7_9FLAO|nr:hypothetical protein [Tamlana fucoidanivorans]TNJ43706.1 hypothetical protein FGF67_10050 [Tamlana fucoidanivorans]
MNTIDSLYDKIDRAKELDFGQIFDSTLQLFKKVWLKGFLVVLLIVMSAMVIAFAFAAIGLASTNTFVTDNGFNFNVQFDDYFKNVLFSVPQSILVSTITLALLGAFYRICQREVQGEQGVDDYFYFFRNGYFSKLLMLGILYTGISTLAQFLFVLPVIYVMIPLSYFSLFFAFNPDLSETELVKASFKLGNKKWFISFGTLFVAALLGMLGVLGCGIGLLFTISIAYLPLFFIYKEVVGFDETSEIDQIGTNTDY